MGNEHEKLTKESSKMRKEAFKNKRKNSKAIASDEEDSDGEENNNNEKERQLNEYDKEMSKILFDEEPDLDKNERFKKSKKKDKKSELQSYAQQIAEEQFMEDINRSKSFNREAPRRGYDNNNESDSDDYNEFKKRKERKNKKKKKKENENGQKNINNLKVKANDEIDDIKNNKKRNISINKKRTISNDNLNINHELEKNAKKKKIEVNNNLSKTTANDLFDFGKKREGKEKKEKPNKNYKTKISSPQIDHKYKTLKSASVNTNEKNLNEEKNNNNLNKKTTIISKSIYSKVKPEDLRIVLLYMKNGNNKYQEGLDLCGKRKYMEAQSCFNYARNSYTSLNKLMNGNPKAYPTEFRIVISQKINEKLQLVFQSIRECNEFIRNKKTEIIIKNPEKAQNILRYVNANINRKNSNNNFNINNNTNNNNFHNNYRNYNNGNITNNNKNNHLKEEDEMDEKIKSEIMVKNPGVKFKDIIGMKEMKRILYEIIVVPTIRPDLFTGIRKPQRGILLFGPPGTGKTMIAKAIASECNSTFFNISASSLTSKWVGESEKTVKSLFKLAYKKVPSIIFIDEIDSILSKRSENENEATKRLKTEFLIQFDGLGSNTNARLLVIAATNRPMDLDDALLRRLPKRVYCGPLDEEGRFEFIKKVINRVETKLTDKDIKEIAKMTNGYSNSDLKELCKEAAFQPVRELTMEQIMRINKFRPLVKKDLVKSVQKIRGSLSHKIINELLKWNEQFGGV